MPAPTRGQPRDRRAWGPLAVVLAGPEAPPAVWAEGPSGGLTSGLCSYRSASGAEAPHRALDAPGPDPLMAGVLATGGRARRPGCRAAGTPAGWGRQPTVRRAQSQTAARSSPWVSAPGIAA
jgi:hypothetical protein